MLETILTRIILHYANQYIKDIQTESFSLWSGDIALQNLELKLDVLQNILKVPEPFELTRGFIKELRIQATDASPSVAEGHGFAPPPRPGDGVPFPSADNRSESEDGGGASRGKAGDSTARGETGRTGVGVEGGDGSVPVPMSVDGYINSAGVPSSSAGSVGVEAAESGQAASPIASGGGGAPVVASSQPQQTGWVLSLLKTILANLVVSVTNLVLKFVDKRARVVASVTVGEIVFFPTSPPPEWKKRFCVPQGPQQLVHRVGEANDITVCLDLLKNAQQQQHQSGINISTGLPLAPLPPPSLAPAGGAAVEREAKERRHRAEAPVLSRACLRVFLGALSLQMTTAQWGALLSSCRNMGKGKGVSARGIPALGGPAAVSAGKKGNTDGGRGGDGDSVLRPTAGEGTTSAEETGSLRELSETGGERPSGSLRGDVSGGRLVGEVEVLGGPPVQGGGAEGEMGGGVSVVEREREDKKKKGNEKKSSGWMGWAMDVVFGDSDEEEEEEEEAANAEKKRTDSGVFRESRGETVNMKGEDKRPFSSSHSPSGDPLDENEILDKLDILHSSSSFTVLSVSLPRISFTLLRARQFPPPFPADPSGVHQQLRGGPTPPCSGPATPFGDSLSALPIRPTTIPHGAAAALHNPQISHSAGRPSVPNKSSLSLPAVPELKDETADSPTAMMTAQWPAVSGNWGDEGVRGGTDRRLEAAREEPELPLPTGPDQEQARLIAELLQKRKGQPKGSGNPPSSHTTGLPSTVPLPQSMGVSPGPNQKPMQPGAVGGAQTQTGDQYGDTASQSSASASALLVTQGEYERPVRDSVHQQSTSGLHELFAVRVDMLESVVSLPPPSIGPPEVSLQIRKVEASVNKTLTVCSFGRAKDSNRVRTISSSSAAARPLTGNSSSHLQGSPSLPAAQAKSTSLPPHSLDASPNEFLYSPAAVRDRSEQVGADGATPGDGRGVPKGGEMTVELEDSVPQPTTNVTKMSGAEVEIVAEAAVRLGLLVVKEQRLQVERVRRKMHRQRDLHRGSGGATDQDGTHACRLSVQTGPLLVSLPAEFFEVAKEVIEAGESAAPSSVRPPLQGGLQASPPQGVTARESVGERQPERETEREKERERLGTRPSRTFSVQSKTSTAAAGAANAPKANLEAPFGVAAFDFSLTVPEVVLEVQVGSPSSSLIVDVSDRLGGTSKRAQQWLHLRLEMLRASKQSVSDEVEFAILPAMLSESVVFVPSTIPAAVAAANAVANANASAYLPEGAKRRFSPEILPGTENELRQPSIDRLAVGAQIASLRLSIVERSGDGGERGHRDSHGGVHGGFGSALEGVPLVVLSTLCAVWQAGRSRVDFFGGTVTDAQRLPKRGSVSGGSGQEARPEPASSPEKPQLSVQQADSVQAALREARVFLVPGTARLFSSLMRRVRGLFAVTEGRAGEEIGEKEGVEMGDTERRGRLAVILQGLHGACTVMRCAVDGSRASAEAAGGCGELLSFVSAALDLGVLESGMKEGALAGQEPKEVRILCTHQKEGSNKLLQPVLSVATHFVAPSAPAVGIFGFTLSSASEKRGLSLARQVTESFPSLQGFTLPSPFFSSFVFGTRAPSQLGLGFACPPDKCERLCLCIEEGGRGVDSSVFVPFVSMAVSGGSVSFLPAWTRMVFMESEQFGAAGGMTKDMSKGREGRDLGAEEEEQGTRVVVPPPHSHLLSSQKRGEEEGGGEQSVLGENKIGKEGEKEICHSSNQWLEGILLENEVFLDVRPWTVDFVASEEDSVSSDVRQSKPEGTALLSLQTPRVFSRQGVIALEDLKVSAQGETQVALDYLQFSRSLKRRQTQEGGKEREREGEIHVLDVALESSDVSVLLCAASAAQVVRGLKLFGFPHTKGRQAEKRYREEERREGGQEKGGVASKAGGPEKKRNKGGAAGLFRNICVNCAFRAGVCFSIRAAEGRNENVRLLDLRVPEIYGNIHTLRSSEPKLRPCFDFSVKAGRPFFTLKSPAGMRGEESGEAVHLVEWMEEEAEGGGTAFASTSPSLQQQRSGHVRVGSRVVETRGERWSLNFRFSAVEGNPAGDSGHDDCVSADAGREGGALRGSTSCEISSGHKRRHGVSIEFSLLPVCLWLPPQILSSFAEALLRSLALLIQELPRGKKGGRKTRQGKTDVREEESGSIERPNVERETKRVAPSPLSLSLSVSSVTFKFPFTSPPCVLVASISSVSLSLHEPPSSPELPTTGSLFLQIALEGPTNGAPPLQEVLLKPAHVHVERKAPCEVALSTSVLELNFFCGPSNSLCRDSLLPLVGIAQEALDAAAAVIAALSIFRLAMGPPSSEPSAQTFDSKRDGKGGEGVRLTSTVAALTLNWGLDGGGRRDLGSDRAVAGLSCRLEKIVLDVFPSGGGGFELSEGAKGGGAFTGEEEEKGEDGDGNGDVKIRLKVRGVCADFFGSPILRLSRGGGEDVLVFVQYSKGVRIGEGGDGNTKGVSGGQEEIMQKEGSCLKVGAVAVELDAKGFRTRLASCLPSALFRLSLKPRGDGERTGEETVAKGCRRLPPSPSKAFRLRVWSLRVKVREDPAVSGDRCVVACSSAVSLTIAERRAWGPLHIYNGESGLWQTDTRGLSVGMAAEEDRLGVECGGTGSNDVSRVSALPFKVRQSDVSLSEQTGWLVPMSVDIVLEQFCLLGQTASNREGPLLPFFPPFAARLRLHSATTGCWDLRAAPKLHGETSLTVSIPSLRIAFGMEKLWFLLAVIWALLESPQEEETQKTDEGDGRLQDCPKNINDAASESVIERDMSAVLLLPFLIPLITAAGSCPSPALLSGGIGTCPAVCLHTFSHPPGGADPLTRVTAAPLTALQQSQPSSLLNPSLAGRVSAPPLRIQVCLDSPGHVVALALVPAKRPGHFPHDRRGLSDQRGVRFEGPHSLDGLLPPDSLLFPSTAFRVDAFDASQDSFIEVPSSLPSMHSTSEASLERPSDRNPAAFFPVYTRFIVAINSSTPIPLDWPRGSSPSGAGAATPAAPTAGAPSHRPLQALLSGVCMPPGELQGSFLACIVARPKLQKAGNSSLFSFRCSVEEALQASLVSERLLGGSIEHPLAFLSLQRLDFLLASHRRGLKIFFSSPRFSIDLPDRKSGAHLRLLQESTLLFALAKMSRQQPADRSASGRASASAAGIRKGDNISLPVPLWGGVHLSGAAPVWPGCTQIRIVLPGETHITTDAARVSALLRALAACGVMGGGDADTDAEEKAVPVRVMNLLPVPVRVCCGMAALVAVSRSEEERRHSSERVVASPSLSSPGSKGQTRTRSQLDAWVREQSGEVEAFESFATFFPSTAATVGTDGRDSSRPSLNVSSLTLDSSPGRPRQVLSFAVSNTVECGNEDSVPSLCFDLLDLDADPSPKILCRQLSLYPYCAHVLVERPRQPGGQTEVFLLPSILLESALPDLVLAVSADPAVGGSGGHPGGETAGDSVKETGADRPIVYSVPLEKMPSILKRNRNSSSSVRLDGSIDHQSTVSPQEAASACLCTPGTVIGVTLPSRSLAALRIAASTNEAVAMQQCEEKSREGQQPGWSPPVHLRADHSSPHIAATLRETYLRIDSAGERFSTYVPFSVGERVGQTEKEVKWGGRIALCVCDQLSPHEGGTHKQSSDVASNSFRFPRLVSFRPPFVIENALPLPLYVDLVGHRTVHVAPSSVVPLLDFIPSSASLAAIMAAAEGDGSRTEQLMAPAGDRHWRRLSERESVSSPSSQPPPPAASNIHGQAHVTGGGSVCLFSSDGHQQLPLSLVPDGVAWHSSEFPRPTNFSAVPHGTQGESTDRLPLGALHLRPPQGRRGSVQAEGGDERGVNVAGEERRERESSVTFATEPASSLSLSLSAELLLTCPLRLLSATAPLLQSADSPMPSETIQTEGLVERTVVGCSLRPFFSVENLTGVAISLCCGQTGAQMNLPPGRSEGAFLPGWRQGGKGKGGVASQQPGGRRVPPEGSASPFLSALFGICLHMQKNGAEGEGPEEPCYFWTASAQTCRTGKTTRVTVVLDTDSRRLSYSLPLSVCAVILVSLEEQRGPCGYGVSVRLEAPVRMSNRSPHPLLVSALAAGLSQDSKMHRPGPGYPLRPAYHVNARSGRRRVTDGRDTTSILVGHDLTGVRFGNQTTSPVSSEETSREGIPLLVLPSRAAALLHAIAVDWGQQEGEMPGPEQLLLDPVSAARFHQAVRREMKKEKGGELGKKGKRRISTGNEGREEPVQQSLFGREEEKGLGKLGAETELETSASRPSFLFSTIEGSESSTVRGADDSATESSDRRSRGEGGGEVDRSGRDSQESDEEGSASEDELAVGVRVRSSKGALADAEEEMEGLDPRKLYFAIRAAVSAAGAEPGEDEGDALRGAVWTDDILLPLFPGGGLAAGKGAAQDWLGGGAARDVQVATDLLCSERDSRGRPLSTALVNVLYGIHRKSGTFTIEFHPSVQPPLVILNDSPLFIAASKPHISGPTARRREREARQAGAEGRHGERRRSSAGGGGGSGGDPRATSSAGDGRGSCQALPLFPAVPMVPFVVPPATCAAFPCAPLRTLQVFNARADVGGDAAGAEGTAGGAGTRRRHEGAGGDIRTDIVMGTRDGTETRQTQQVGSAADSTDPDLASVSGGNTVGGLSPSPLGSSSASGSSASSSAVHSFERAGGGVGMQAAAAGVLRGRRGRRRGREEGGSGSSSWQSRLGLRLCALCSSIPSAVSVWGDQQGAARRASLKDSVSAECLDDGGSGGEAGGPLRRLRSGCTSGELSAFWSSFVLIRGSKGESAFLVSSGNQAYTHSGLRGDRRGSGGSAHAGGEGHAAVLAGCIHVEVLYSSAHCIIRCSFSPLPVELVWRAELAAAGQMDLIGEKKMWAWVTVSAAESGGESGNKGGAWLPLPLSASGTPEPPCPPDLDSEADGDGRLRAFVDFFWEWSDWKRETRMAASGSTYQSERGENDTTSSSLWGLERLGDEVERLRTYGGSRGGGNGTDRGDLFQFERRLEVRVESRDLVVHAHLNNNSLASRGGGGGGRHAVHLTQLSYVYASEREKETRWSWSDAHRFNEDEDVHGWALRKIHSLSAEKIALSDLSGGQSSDPGMPCLALSIPRLSLVLSLLKPPPPLPSYVEILYADFRADNQGPNPLPAPRFAHAVNLQTLAETLHCAPLLSSKRAPLPVLLVFPDKAEATADMEQGGHADETEAVGVANGVSSSKPLDIPCVRVEFDDQLVRDVKAFMEALEVPSASSSSSSGQRSGGDESIESKGKKKTGAAAPTFSYVTMRTCYVSKVSVRVSLRLQTPLFLSFSDLALSFPSVRIGDVVTPSHVLWAELGAHYAALALLEAPVAGLFSFDLLGNPAKAARHVARGVAELLQSPFSLRGVGGFARHLSSASLSTISSFSDSLRRNLPLQAQQHMQHHQLQQARDRMGGLPGELVNAAPQQTGQQESRWWGSSVGGAVVGAVSRPIGSLLGTISRVSKKYTAPLEGPRDFRAHPRVCESCARPARLPAFHSKSGGRQLVVGLATGWDRGEGGMGECFETEGTDDRSLWLVSPSTPLVFGALFVESLLTAVRSLEAERRRIGPGIPPLRDAPSGYALYGYAPFLGIFASRRGHPEGMGGGDEIGSEREREKENVILCECRALFLGPRDKSRGGMPSAIAPVSVLLTDRRVLVFSLYPLPSELAKVPLSLGGISSSAAERDSKPSSRRGSKESNEGSNLEGEKEKEKEKERSSRNRDGGEEGLLIQRPVFLSIRFPCCQPSTRTVAAQQHQSAASSSSTSSWERETPPERKCRLRCSEEDLSAEGSVSSWRGRGISLSLEESPISAGTWQQEDARQSQALGAEQRPHSVVGRTGGDDERRIMKENGQEAVSEYLPSLAWDLQVPRSRHFLFLETVTRASKAANRKVISSRSE
uniref:Uncharacterized protein n=1 Tax=Chromera velia CCMP2878 TaxID=1169474 RepID=A0A0G4FFP3_9ALVE|eukprot:Cvel_16742.t1-p1 / transcript=Cvel_16742.t1 / gene=Cvel_16742 / organism=Chromera_velia_CCMP2878 / gene_product=Vacuolar protein sorting-associated protein 13B, putative / transcript_product=Vacuolar protein sorting-associated protein 13B, putative / location=Cvel_scaffold1303:3992-32116(-) / protein_length=5887 / sequence_SO=supercontig / SO=protein_coding / is_pseudo=false